MDHGGRKEKEVHRKEEQLPGTDFLSILRREAHVRCRGYDGTFVHSIL